MSQCTLINSKLCSNSEFQNQVESSVEKFSLGEKLDCLVLCMLQPQKPFSARLKSILRLKFHEMGNVGWNTVAISLVASIGL